MSHDQKCIRHKITVIAHYCLHFADLGDPGHPAAWLLHMALSMHVHTSLAIQLVLPSPLLPHTTHSHFIVSVSKEAIRPTSICQHSLAFSF